MELIHNSKYFENEGCQKLADREHQTHPRPQQALAAEDLPQDRPPLAAPPRLPPPHHLRRVALPGTEESAVQQKHPLHRTGTTRQTAPAGAGPHPRQLRTGGRVHPARLHQVQRGLPGHHPQAERAFGGGALAAAVRGGRGRHPAEHRVHCHPRPRLRAIGRTGDAVRRRGGREPAGTHQNGSHQPQRDLQTRPHLPHPRAQQPRLRGRPLRTERQHQRQRDPGDPQGTDPSAIRKPEEACESRQGLIVSTLLFSPFLSCLDPGVGCLRWPLCTAEYNLSPDYGEPGGERARRQLLADDCRHAAGPVAAGQRAPGEEVPAADGGGTRTREVAEQAQTGRGRHAAGEAQRGRTHRVHLLHQRPQEQRVRPRHRQTRPLPRKTRVQERPRGLRRELPPEDPAQPAHKYQLGRRAGGGGAIRGDLAKHLAQAVLVEHEQQQAQGAGQRDKGATAKHRGSDAEGTEPHQPPLRQAQQGLRRVHRGALGPVPAQLQEGGGVREGDAGANRRLVHLPGGVLPDALPQVDHQLHRPRGGQVRPVAAQRGHPGDLGREQRLPLLHAGHRHPAKEDPPGHRRQTTPVQHRTPHPLVLPHRPQTPDRGALLRLHLRDVGSSGKGAPGTGAGPVGDSQEAHLYRHRQLPPAGRAGRGVRDRLRQYPEHRVLHPLQDRQPHRRDPHAPHLPPHRLRRHRLLLPRAWQLHAQHHLRRLRVPRVSRLPGPPRRPPRRRRQAQQRQQPLRNQGHAQPEGGHRVQGRSQRSAPRIPRLRQGGGLRPCFKPVDYSPLWDGLRTRSAIDQILQLVRKVQPTPSKNCEEKAGGQGQTCRAGKDLVKLSSNVGNSIVGRGESMITVGGKVDVISDTEEGMQKKESREHQQLKQSGSALKRASKRPQVPIANPPKILILSKSMIFAWLNIVRSSSPTHLFLAPLLLHYFVLSPSTLITPKNLQISFQTLSESLVICDLFNIYLPTRRQ